jgi:hypothetical protein
MHLEYLEETIVKMINNENISFLFEHELIKREMVCLGTCNSQIKLKNCKNFVKGNAWLCFNKTCTHYHVHRSVRDLFFCGLW